MNEPIKLDTLAPIVSERWLIHKSGRGWYRPNAAGYTNNPAEAGRYTHAKAVEHSHPNGLSGSRDGMTIWHENEVHGAMPATSATDIAAELAEFARRFAEMSDVEADFIEPGMCGYADGFAIRTAARAALAKWEASK
jgi:hypothetical protein